MAKKSEVTIEEKLRALYDLQLIDSRVDEIRNVRGELPLEVEDLENEIGGLQKKMGDFQEELSDFEFQTKELKNRIEVAKEEFKKYEENLKNVRNNREYNSIIKEQEFQELEIQLAEKKIKEFVIKGELKTESVNILVAKLKERNIHLDAKKSELDEILKETEKEEGILAKKSAEFESKIEAQLFEAYNKIRGNVKNGMAIVPIDRGASGGSYFTIPPQIQMEIASRQKIITDEHSGRILVDAELAQEEKEKISAIFSKK
jgi:predicted  nucleic acid-binding Zn-ribbon protein